MDTNPFDSWYEAQLVNKEIRYLAGKWSYYTIEFSGEQHTEVKAKRLSLAEVDDWVLRRVGFRRERYTSTLKRRPVSV